MMKSEILLSTAYLAPVEYYTKLLAYNKVYIERYDNYIKQTYRNRCVIAAADGPLSLTIPTEKSDSPKQLVKDIRISDHGNWRHMHWNALVSAYKNSPFFEYYADDFAPFYEKKYPFLVDFNDELCSMICSFVDIQPVISYTDSYERDIEQCDDFREIIHPKRDYTVCDIDFTAKPYYQVFKDRFGFLPNLSIVDLLFNMGPESLIVLRDSIIN